MKTYIVKFTVIDKWEAYKDAIQICANNKIEARKSVINLLNELKAKCKINKVERSAEQLWKL
jgi:hypothetical protein